MSEQIKEEETIKLVGELKDKVEKAENQEEAKEIIKEAGMELTDEELSGVSGGRGVITENPMGGYIYSDETGSVNISPKDWIWLRDQYNDPNPEEIMK